MKPVNFFEDKQIKVKTKKPISKNFLIILVLIVIIGGISFDYFYLNNKLNSLKEEYESISLLEKDYEEVLSEHKLLKEQKSEIDEENIIVKNLEMEKDKENELLEILITLNDLNSQNTYFTNLYYSRDNTIVIKGDSIENSKIMTLLEHLNEKFSNKFEIEEINFSNTYYKFVFKERSNINDI